jgi:hypothetical protein
VDRRAVPLIARRGACGPNSTGPARRGTRARTVA